MHLVWMKQVCDNITNHSYCNNPYTVVADAFDVVLLMQKGGLSMVS